MKLFANVDEDKNGFITFDEYFKYRAGTLKDVYAEQKATFKKEFDKFDTNKDGVLDFEEVVRFSMRSVELKDKESKISKKFYVE